jgi:hypothetical protein
MRGHDARVTYNDGYDQSYIQESYIHKLPVEVWALFIEAGILVLLESRTKSQ